jgi:hypothetical protein
VRHHGDSGVRRQVVGGGGEETNISCRRRSMGGLIDDGKGVTVVMGSGQSRRGGRE